MTEAETAVAAATRLAVFMLKTMVSKWMEGEW
jgi:hypothetical protein